MEELLKQVSCRPAIKPFVCVSMDHDDIAVEISHLTCQVFPKINEHFKERGSSFSPILLTINPEDYHLNKSYKDQVIHTYLSNITEAAPCFISVIGSNYGMCLCPNGEEQEEKEKIEWYQGNLENAAKHGYTWILEEDNKYASLLELGITEAVFRHKSDFCFFYYKENAEEGSRSLKNDNTIDASKARKLKELKQQIIDTELPVSTFASVAQLGESVLEDWVKVLNTIYPPLDKRLLTPSMKVFLQDRLNTESRIRYYSNIFLHSEHTAKIMIEMRKHTEHLIVKKEENKTVRYSWRYKDEMHDGTVAGKQAETVEWKPIIVLTGSRGSGKSAAIGTFLNELSNFDLTCPVFIYFADGFGQRNDIVPFIKKIIMRMRYFYKHDSISLYDHDYLPSSDDLMSAFQNCLTFGPCIIIIDGLDFLSTYSFCDAGNVKGIPWLPPDIPETSRLIFTTTFTDHCLKCFETRNDVRYLHLGSSLSSDQIEKLVSTVVLHPNRAVVTDQIKKMNNVRQNGNPLFTVALSNLVGTWCTYGNFDKLLPSNYEPSHIGDLWRKIIEIWTSEIGWCLPSILDKSHSSTKRRYHTHVKSTILKSQAFSGWVADLLRLLTVSRGGLSEEALLSCLQEMGYRGSYSVSLLDLKVFRHVSRLAITEDNRGRLKFTHASLREAVDRNLLQSLTYPLHQRPISPFKQDWECQKEEFHRMVVAYVKSLPHCLQKVIELPWQLRMLRDMASLGETITEIPCFLTLSTSFPGSDLMADFCDYVQCLTNEKLRFDDLVLQMLQKAESRVDDETVQEGINHDKGTLVHDLMMKTEDQTLTTSELVCLQYYSAKMLIYFGYQATAESILTAASRTAYLSLRADDQDVLCSIQLCLGDQCLRNGRTDEANTWFMRAEGTMTGMVQTGHWESVYLNYIHGTVIDRETFTRMLLEVPFYAPSLMRKDSQRPRTAGSIRSQGTRAVTPVRSNLKPNSPYISTTSTPTRTVSSFDHKTVFVNLKSRFDLAGRYFERCGSLAGKACTLRHLGILANWCHLSDQSEKYLQHSISLYREWYGSYHSVLAEVLDDLATTLMNQGDFQSTLRINEAEELLREGAKMKEKSCGIADVSTARSYYQLAKILVSKRRRDATREAKDLFQRALDILVAEKGFYHPETVFVRKSLFDLHREPTTHQRHDRTLTFPSVTRKVTTPIRLLKR